MPGKSPDLSPPGAWANNGTPDWGLPQRSRGKEKARRALLANKTFRAVLVWPEGVSVVSEQSEGEAGRQREEIFHHPAASSWGSIITQSPGDCLTTCPWNRIRFIKCLEIPGEEAAQDKHSNCYFGILSQPDHTEVKKVYSGVLGQPHV